MEKYKNDFEYKKKMNRIKIDSDFTNYFQKIFINLNIFLYFNDVSI